MHDDIFLMIAWAFNHRDELLAPKVSEADAADRVYEFYCTAEIVPTVGDQDATDQYAKEEVKFARFCDQVQTYSHGNVHYWRPNEGPKDLHGFHKLLSTTRFVLGKDPEKRVYVHCATPKGAKDVMLLAAEVMCEHDSGIMMVKSHQMTVLHTRSDSVVAYLESVPSDQPGDDQKRYVRKLLARLATYSQRFPHHLADGLPPLVKPAKVPQGDNGGKVVLRGIGYADEPPRGTIIAGDQPNKPHSFGKFYAKVIVRALKAGGPTFEGVCDKLYLLLREKGYDWKKPHKRIPPQFQSPTAQPITQPSPIQTAVPQQQPAQVGGPQGTPLQRKAYHKAREQPQTTANATPPQRKAFNRPRDVGK